ncbi:MAG TPA: hydroxymethylglutaryl-CoA lyase, partial [Acetobacteraceae bacterium]|nr:hydroxymethylglutaryl-CoA lyase [Acetobacteraceae bacterium]
VEFGALWLNEKGLQRASSYPSLTLDGYLFMSASEVFGKRNQNRSRAEEIEVQRGMARVYAEQGLALTRCTIMAAFGCNFQGDIPVGEPLACIEALLGIAAETHPGAPPPAFVLADTMAWATPGSVKRLIGAVRERWPDVPVGLHLHDTRGLAIANAAAGLDMGVVRFDAAVAGLGGCPFAKHKGAAGNICTEDLVFLCDESGVETGIDLDALAECGRLAEEVVGHPLPGRVKQGGTLKALREGIAAARAA